MTVSLDGYASKPWAGLADRIGKGRGDEESHRMAAKGMQVSWRWESGTISTKLDVIWEMSVNAADPHVAAGLQSSDLGEYRLHVVPLDGSHLGDGDENIEEGKGDQ